MNKHFEGTTINYIACLNVDYKSEREEAFQVLPLNSRSIHVLFQGPHTLQLCQYFTEPCADVAGLTLSRSAGRRAYDAQGCLPWCWTDFDRLHQSHHSQAALRTAKHSGEMLACG